MRKFCTNCGHANNSTNRICINCGTPLTTDQKQAMAPKEPKKPMPFKTKLVAGIAAVLLASLFGVYTWGTKTASAETTVAKFFEALKERDAVALTKYVALSNGEQITEKQATAFIDLYQYITPDELYEIAAVEKNGKVAGLFDAHKVILSPQQLSFYFPYDGLSLELNGEVVQAVYDDDGEYIFSGIVPGDYEAEFVFDDVEMNFAHLFNLTVEYQLDSSYIASIDEDLSLGSTYFQVTIADDSPKYETKIVIGEKEYPVDEYGETEEIGPFLMDGSMKAQAKIKFPWGETTSEAVPIDGGYLKIDISQLDEKMEEQLINQLVLFLEEDIKASGTRDSSVYTTLKPAILKSKTGTFDSWKENGYFYKGSLTKINLDGESVQISSEGGKVIVDAEVETEGAYYIQSESPKLDRIKYQIHIVFSYDSDKKKWLVEKADKYDHYDRPFTSEPMQTIEGSQALHEVKGSSDAVKQNNQESEQSADQPVEIEESTVSSMDVEEFMNEYNSLSVVAMNTGDFSVVSYMVSKEGPKWQESADYIDYIYKKGIKEEHLGSILEKVEEIDDMHVKVTTIDRFIIHGAESSSEKAYRSVNILKKNGNSWLVNELLSSKEI